MKIYRVVPALSSTDENPVIEFFGDEPTEVFQLLKDARPDRHYHLWEGDRCLGLLRRNGNGFWELR
ncbi:hypothetical protein [Altererythrobacter sp. MF3-039]|uniref:hypothetical protein n=1 Tax=Altererythrobacter sp. MF3-039 TaxID=3252901 RepID=UPI00390C8AC2